jgi:hypothetical protein
MHNMPTAGIKPPTPVMTGNANIPAPIQLPAMRRIPPKTLPYLRFMGEVYQEIPIYAISHKKLHTPRLATNTRTDLQICN